MRTASPRVGLIADSGELGAITVIVTPYRQNASIVFCKRTMKAALIDPGGDVDHLLAELDARDLTLEQIWITHGHQDHVGGVPSLLATTSAKAFGPHRGDGFLLDGVGFRSAGERPLSELVNFLGDGARVSLGALEFEVRHCPGHTPGHLVFIHHGARLAWVGDVLFAGTIGNTETPYGDLQQLIASIRNRLWPLGNDIRFVPGHGRTSTFGAERQLNAYVSDLVIASLDVLS